MYFMMISPAFYDSPCIMLPPDVATPTPKQFKRILELNLVEGIKCVPHTLATLYEDPESRALLRSLEYVLYGGAVLDRAMGDDLNRHTRLSAVIGSTENGGQCGLRPLDKSLWYTYDFVPEAGCKMVPIHSVEDVGSDLHELVFERPQDGTGNVFQPAFWNPAVQGLTRIKTSELYAPVPDMDGQNRWEFKARKDDLTKLSWLAKFHAEDIESRIQQHPDVKSVCVGGEGRPAPYVIVEPKEGVLDRESEEQLLNRLYTTVIARTNAVDIEEIHIPKETLLVAKEGKPLKRNVKQLVLRKEVEKDYREEIEQAYARLEAGATPSK
jgi:acyl-coenzyme A synthetase/AMP-(fatty) acid ligase